MNKLSVLISGVGGDIGQSVARALAGDFRVLGCDMEDSSVTRLFVKKFFRVPSAAGGGAYLEVIDNILRQAEIDIFIPVTEPEIMFLNSEREWMAGVGSKVLLNNQKVVVEFSDKLKTVLFLHAHGIKAPRSVLLRDMVRDEWCFPVIVKSRHGCGSKSVHKVVDDLGLEYYIRRDEGDLIVQEYIDEAEGEFTTGVFSDGINTESITFRRRLGYGGLSREVIFEKDEKMEYLARHIAKHVGLVGSINIQSRKSGGEHVPFEINPRLSSTVFLRQTFGFEDLRWWIACSQGECFAYKPRYSHGVAVRVLGENFVNMEAL